MNDNAQITKEIKIKEDIFDEILTQKEMKL